MNKVSMPLRLAPNNLTQSILLGWDFSIFSINLGVSSNPAVEQAILENVGSYGKQIGHIASALEVVINHFKLLEADMPEKDRDALLIFLGDLAEIRKIKEKDNT